MITVTIPSETYFELLQDQRMLIALRMAGVDNWEGFTDALDYCREMQEEVDDPT